MYSLRLLGLIIGTLSGVRTAASIPRQSSSRSVLALERRQSGIPTVPQCQSVCNPVVTILNTGSCPPAQCCTMLFQGSYFECLKCVGIATNATTADFVQAQSLVDGLTVACSKEGFTLPELTFPGQNPNRTLATVSASQTSVQTTSQITISTLPPPGSSSPTGSPTIGTISQKTVSELPTTAAQAASSTGTPAPTTSPNAAYRQVSLDTRMLGFIVAGWMVL